MRIIQRKFSNTFTFEFGDDALTYTRADAYGSHSFDIPYGSIGMDPRLTMERNGTLFNGALLLSIWGAAQTIHALALGDWTGLIYLVPGPACLLLHSAIQTTVTSLSSDEGEIALLHDKQFDTVMAEIRQRRKKQLLDWYGNINFANDPEDEIRKFHWLHSQHLISGDQLQKIVAAIRNNDSAGLDDFDEPLPPRQ